MGFPPSIQLPFSNDGARAHLSGRWRNITSPALLPLPRSLNKRSEIWGEELIHLQHLELEEMSLSDGEIIGDMKL